MPGPLAGYVRVSHRGARADDRFHSPDEQAAEIARWAKQRGIQVEMLPPDIDSKGSDRDRPIFRQAVDGVRSGRYSGVVVAYLSRAGRDLRLMLDLWDEVESAGGQVYSARENIDATTTSGRLHRNVLASVDQHYLEERREGFARSRVGAIERGIWKQRQTPRGYSRDPETRRLVPNDQAGEVRRAFEARAAGVAPTSIARTLAMTPSGVRQLLRNRVYLGELRDGAAVNLTAHEPLVSVDLFEAAQRSVSRPARARGAPALLAGLVRCAGCGHLMTRGGHSALPIYGCPRRHSGVECPAPAAVTAALLDDLVRPIAVTELERLSVQTHEGRGVDHVRTRLARADADLHGYLEAVSPADVGAGAFRAGARAKRAAVDEARGELRDELAKLAVVLPENTTAAELFESLDGHERNTLLRSLLAAVVVRRAGGRGARVALGDRVRVLKYGATLCLPPRRGGVATGIVPIRFDDLDDDGVLRPLAGEDRL